MSKATENSKVTNGVSRFFRKSVHQKRYRSNAVYATMQYVNDQKCEYSLNEDERCFLRQVLVSSGMGRGEMLALLG